MILTCLLRSEAVAEAIIILQESIRGNGLQLVGMDEVVDDIEVPAPPAELLVLQQNTVQFEVEHSSYLNLYLLGCCRGQVVVISRIFPRAARRPGLAEREVDAEVSVYKALKNSDRLSDTATPDEATEEKYASMQLAFDA